MFSDLIFVGASYSKAIKRSVALGLFTTQVVAEVGYHPMASGMNSPIELRTMYPPGMEDQPISSPGASTPMTARATRMAQMEAEVKALERQQELAAARRIELEARLEAERAAEAHTNTAQAAASAAAPTAEHFQMTPLESFSDTVHPTPVAAPSGSQPPQPTSEMALLLARFAQMQADLAAMKLTVERQTTVINHQRGVIEQNLDGQGAAEDLPHAERESTGNVLRPIDKKLVDKPKVYKGVLSEFDDWQENPKFSWRHRTPVGADFWTPSRRRASRSSTARWRRRSPRISAS